MRLPCGGFGAAAAQHSHMFESWFAFVAGLKIVSPSTPADAKGLMKSAIRDNSPVIFFEHRQCYSIRGDVNDDAQYLIPLGKGDIKRQGSDVTIITYSYMVHFALKAAEILEKSGIHAEIVDLRTIKPMDTDLIIESVKKTGRAVCLQETWGTCSVASEVAATIAERIPLSLKAPIKRIASPDCPAPFSPELEAYVLPSVDRIVAEVRDMFP